MITKRVNKIFYYYYGISDLKKKWKILSYFSTLEISCLDYISKIGADSLVHLTIFIIDLDNIHSKI